MEEVLHLDIVGWQCFYALLLAKAKSTGPNEVYDPFTDLSLADRGFARAPTPFDPHPGRHLGF